MRLPDLAGGTLVAFIHGRFGAPRRPPLWMPPSSVEEEDRS
jgi:hypothetical protein